MTVYLPPLRFFYYLSGIYVPSVKKCMSLCIRIAHTQVFSFSISTIVGTGSLPDPCEQCNETTTERRP